MTSACKGRGKVKYIKVSKLGESQTVTEFDAFTCVAYRQSRISNMDSEWYIKVNDSCSKDKVVPSKNVDLESLPPCRISLNQTTKLPFGNGDWKLSNIYLLQKAIDNDDWCFTATFVHMLG